MSTIIDKGVFLDMAYNQPRDAVIALYAQLERVERERAELAEGLTRAELERVKLAEHAATLERTLDAHAGQIVALQQTVAGLFEAVNAPPVV